MPIPFVVMKWTRANEVREFKKYTSDHVNAFFSMLKTTQSRPFRLICLTDDAADLHPEIEVISIPTEGREIIDTYGKQFCKLYLFSREFRETVKQSFIYCDLDVAILGDLTNLWGGNEDLIIMEGENGSFLHKIEKLHNAPLPLRRSFALAMKLLRRSSARDAFNYLAIRPKRWCRFNSSFMVIAKDQPDDVWKDFSPDAVQNEIQLNNIVGSDQALLHLRKSGQIKIVNRHDGFWRRREVDCYYEKTGEIPVGIKMIIFAGQHSKPWSEANKRVDWIDLVYKQTICLFLAHSVWATDIRLLCG